tara:strand:+ start:1020 stop:1670 length:651 start_codon:yes stop_codon:yes gene_type:complete
MRNHPISPATEPMQYRAIGLVRGTYCPIDEAKFTRGMLIDQNGIEIESVVLGRMLSLMKRHVKIAEHHLWVVYPRCRNSEHLHLQIGGIWEPSTLISKQQKEQYKLEDQTIEGDNYFSIRGELIFTKPDRNEMIIKIRQKPRTSVKKALPFKIFIKGTMPVNELNNFLSCDVRRVGQELVIESYKSIGAIHYRKDKSGIRTNTINGDMCTENNKKD